MSQLEKDIENGRILKNNGSWMYCGECNKTVGYLVYTTYQNFKYNFTCKCGNKGFFNLKYETDLPIESSSAKLKVIKNRLCCPNDDSPLFSIVQSNIQRVEYSVVCKKCSTHYSAQCLHSDENDHA